MHNNFLYDKGAVALGNALLTNDALQFLSLSSNGVGDEGAIALAEGLKGNRALRRLDLYHNFVGDKGAIAFAEAIRVNRALNSLHLDTNSIGPGGAFGLAKAIAGEPASLWKAAVEPCFLGELTLMYNQINNEAADAVMAAAASHPHLHNLALDANHQIHSDTRERWEQTHVPTYKDRHALATWLVDTGLFSDLHHDDDGPPLASPYANVVAGLRAHTRKGRRDMRTEDSDSLADRPELHPLNETQRATLAGVILQQIAKDIEFEEKHSKPRKKDGRSVFPSHLLHDEL